MVPEGLEVKPVSPLWLGSWLLGVADVMPIPAPENLIVISDILELGSMITYSNTNSIEVITPDGEPVNWTVGGTSFLEG
ncbi:MAG: hypothetical protein AAFN93_14120 [Bacteroidota bacterium]